MAVLGSAFNAVYLLPKFSQLYGIPLDAIIGMGAAINPAIKDLSSLILIAVVPFNFIKGVLCSVLTILLYKRVSPILHK